MFSTLKQPLQQPVDAGGGSERGRDSAACPPDSAPARLPPRTIQSLDHLRQAHFQQLARSLSTTGIPELDPIVGAAILSFGFGFSTYEPGKRLNLEQITSNLKRDFHSFQEISRLIGPTIAMLTSAGCLVSKKENYSLATQFQSSQNPDLQSQIQELHEFYVSSHEYFQARAAEEIAKRLQRARSPTAAIIEFKSPAKVEAPVDRELLILRRNFRQACQNMERALTTLKGMEPELAVNLTLINELLLTGAVPGTNLRAIFETWTPTRGQREDVRNTINFMLRCGVPIPPVPRGTSYDLWPKWWQATVECVYKEDVLTAKMSRARNALNTFGECFGRLKGVKEEVSVRSPQDLPAKESTFFDIVDRKFLLPFPETSYETDLVIAGRWNAYQIIQAPLREFISAALGKPFPESEEEERSKFFSTLIPIFERAYANTKLLLEPGLLATANRCMQMLGIMAGHEIEKGVVVDTKIFPPEFRDEILILDTFTKVLQTDLGPKIKPQKPRNFAEVVKVVAQIAWTLRAVYRPIRQVSQPIIELTFALPLAARVIADRHLNAFNALPNAEPFLRAVQKVDAMLVPLLRNDNREFPDRHAFFAEFEQDVNAALPAIRELQETIPPMVQDLRQLTGANSRTLQ